MGFACLLTWSENYGDEQSKIGENFLFAFNSIRNGFSFNLFLNFIF